MGGSLPSNSTSRSICHRRPFGQNLRSALEPDSTKPQLKSYRHGRSFSDFWKSSEATASPSICGRPQPSAGRKVQWRVGPCRTVLRATAAKAGTVCPPDTSGLRVRANGSSDDEAVRGVVQRSHHLKSTRYQKCQKELEKVSAAGQVAAEVAVAAWPRRCSSTTWCQRSRNCFTEK